MLLYTYTAFQGDQKKLFQIVDKLLGRGKQTVLPEFTNAKDMAQMFNEFFISKIATIRTSLADLEHSTDVMQCPSLNTLLHSSSSKLQHLEPTASEEIVTIIKKSIKSHLSIRSHSHSFTS